ncbi:hypothetical protein STANM309S_02789 [Streptomyces tanashiensis]
MLGGRYLAEPGRVGQEVVVGVRESGPNMVIGGWPSLWGTAVVGTVDVMGYGLLARKKG